MELNRAHKSFEQYTRQPYDHSAERKLVQKLGWLPTPQFSTFYLTNIIHRFFHFNVLLFDVFHELFGSFEHQQCIRQRYERRTGLQGESTEYHQYHLHGWVRSLFSTMIPTTKRCTKVERRGSNIII